MKKNSRPFIIVSFIFALLACESVAGIIIHENRVRSYEHVSQVVESVSFNIKTVLKAQFDITKFWQSYLQQKQMNTDDFELLASSLYSESVVLYSIELIPGGVISDVYPGHHKRIRQNRDIFTDPVIGEIAKWSRLTGQPFVSNPIALEDMMMGFQICTPIYISEPGKLPEFWGFSSVTLKFDSFFDESDIYMLQNEHIKYELKSMNPVKSVLEPIIASEDHDFNKPVMHSFAVYNTMWTFFAESEKDWHDNLLIAVSPLMAFFIAALLCFAINALRNQILSGDSFKRLSYIDSLTKLWNTRKFYEVMNKLMAKKDPFALLYIDLNDFKPVNDTYGHKAGDDLLQIVAKKLRNCVREGDEVYRLGGDEFSIILPNSVPPAGINGLCGRIKNSIARETIIGDAHVHVSASIGYSGYPGDATSIEGLVRIAEEMMYADKKAQRKGR